MSQVQAMITSITENKTLHMLGLECEGKALKMLSLDLNANIKVGSKVLLNIKPLAVGLGKDVSGSLSFSNQLSVEVDTIEEGEILSSVQLLCGHTKLESLIATTALKKMDLKPAQKITAYIRASEISIAEVLS